LADRFDSANGASGAVDTHEATSAGVVDVSVVAVVAVKTFVLFRSSPANSLLNFILVVAENAEIACPS
jgi:hypothetical protein